MLKIIKIHANDYFLLQEKAERQGRPAADLIHDLLTKGSDKSPYTQIIIGVWLNYWAAAHGIKYNMRGKDGQAAKYIGSHLSKQVVAHGKRIDDPEPQVIGQIFEKILLSLKGGFYYGKELSTISGGFNTIIAVYRSKNVRGTQGSW